MRIQYDPLSVSDSRHVQPTAQAQADRAAVHVLAPAPVLLEPGVELVGVLHRLRVAASTRVAVPVPRALRRQTHLLRLRGRRGGRGRPAGAGEAEHPDVGARLNAAHGDAGLAQPVHHHHTGKSRPNDQHLHVHWRCRPGPRTRCPPLPPPVHTRQTPLSPPSLKFRPDRPLSEAAAARAGALGGASAGLDGLRIPGLGACPRRWPPR